MWVCFPFGFVSVVSAKQLHLPGQPIDPDRVVVRGRVLAHLEALVQRHPDLLQGTEITEDPGRDYRFRFLTQRLAWAAVLSKEASEISYTNFKDQASRVMGFSDPYLQFLHVTWSAGLSMQHPGRSSDRSW